MRNIAVTQPQLEYVKSTHLQIATRLGRQPWHWYRDVRRLRSGLHTFHEREAADTRKFRHNVSRQSEPA